MDKGVYGSVSGEQAARCRTIVGQRQGGESTLANNDWMDKLNGNVLGIGGPGSVSESEESTTLIEAAGHSPAGFRYLLRFNSKKSFWDSHTLLKAPGEQHL